MDCPSCGAPLPPGANFCRSCGKPANPPNRCMDCGSPIQPGSAFCPKCGSNQSMPFPGEQPSPPHLSTASSHALRSYQSHSTQPNRNRVAIAAIVSFLVVLLACGSCFLASSFGMPRLQAFMAGITGSDSTTAPGSKPSGSLTTISAQLTPQPLPKLGTALVKNPDPARLVQSANWGIVPANQLLLFLKDGLSRKDAESLAAQLGASIVGEVEFFQLYQVETNSSSEADLTASLDRARSLQGVDLAMPNPALLPKQIKGSPCDPLDDPLYKEGNNGRAYQIIGLKSAWDLLRASGIQTHNVHVGVMDSALFSDSDEISGKVTISGFDPQDSTNQPYKDKQGNTRDGGFNHGTLVTHVIAANAGNGGASGVASVLGDKLKVTVRNMYTSKPSYTVTTSDPLDPTKVTDVDGTVYLCQTFVDMQKQIEAGASIINCSFGPAKPSPKNSFISDSYRRFLQAMHNKHPHVLFVAAAGNEDSALDGANYSIGGHKLPNLITVGALDDNGNRAPFSNYASAGGEVSIAAPGVKIAMAIDKQGVSVNASGTSFATPMVAGAAALLRAINPNLTAQQLKSILVQSAANEVTTERQSTKVPDSLGGKVLRVDNAVLRAINDLRQSKGLPPLEGDFLLKMATVDAIAIEKKPAEFTVKASLPVTGEKGADVAIELRGHGTIGGKAQQHLDKPGEVSWEVTITNPQELPVAIITRLDTDSCATILLRPAQPTPTPAKAATPVPQKATEAVMVGQWAGTSTFSKLNIPERGKGRCPNTIPNCPKNPAPGQPLPVLMTFYKGRLNPEQGRLDITTVFYGGVGGVYVYENGRVTLSGEREGGDRYRVEGRVREEGGTLVFEGNFERSFLDVAGEPWDYAATFKVTKDK